MNDFDPNAAAGPDAGIFGLPHGAEASAVILIPVPYEATTSYGGGTALGPAAILAASRQIDLQDPDHGDAWRAGIHMLPADPRFERWNQEAKAAARVVIDAGGVNAENRSQADLVNAHGTRVNAAVMTLARRWLQQDKLIGVVGGDHSVPLGAIRVVAEAVKELSILHVDAHCDLRRAFEGFTYSHASIMDNVLQEAPQVTRIVQVGIRDYCAEELAAIEASGGRVQAFFDRDLADHQLGGGSFAALAKEIVELLGPKVWISFDVDGLDPSLCPHTGTPVPGGLSFREAVFLLRTVVESGRVIVGFDLSEVAPGPTGDEWDANVGARLLYKLCGFALRSRPTSRAVRS